MKQATEIVKEYILNPKDNKKEDVIPKLEKIYLKNLYTTPKTVFCNQTDYLTLEPLKNTQYTEIFTCVQDKLLYGFEIASFEKIKNENNPFNRKQFQENDLKRFEIVKYIYFLLHYINQCDIDKLKEMTNTELKTTTTELIKIKEPSPTQTHKLNQFGIIILLIIFILCVFTTTK